MRVRKEFYLAAGAEAAIFTDVAAVNLDASEDLDRPERQDI